MNKNLLLAAVSLVALSAAAPAVAADLAARPYTKAPPMIATIYDWSGFYIGINGGGGSSHATWDLIGVGLEYGFAPNWSVGAEYNHIFLGGHDQNLTNAGVLVQSDHIKQDVDMGLVRLNYKFGGPIIGKY